MLEIFPIRVKGPATAFVNLCGAGYLDSQQNDYFKL